MVGSRLNLPGHLMDHGQIKHVAGVFTRQCQGNHLGLPVKGDVFHDVCRVILKNG
jgi:hypothetical protein